MEEREYIKKRRAPKEGFSAYEIYQTTHFLVWPALLWGGGSSEILPDYTPKKASLFKGLAKKSPGLYLFTPGDNKKCQFHPLDGQLLSQVQSKLKHLPKVKKEFSRKFTDADEWSRVLKQRTAFFKKVISYYELFKARNPNCLPLEELVYFAVPTSARPSQWISTQDLKQLELKSGEIFRNIILTQRGIETPGLPQWSKALKGKKSFPPELLLKIILRGSVVPQTFEAAAKLDRELLIDILEELRLAGLLQGINLNYLPALFNEFKNFYEEAELRAYLSKDFIQQVYENDEVWLVTPHVTKIFWSEANRIAGELLDEHLKNQGVKHNRSNFALASDPIHWFTGAPLSTIKKEIYLPNSFNYESMKETFLEGLAAKVQLLMRQPQKKHFCGLALTSLKLLAKNEEAFPHLLSIIAQCREFCPPGKEGTHALQLAEFILSRLEVDNGEYIAWLAENLNSLLVYAHNHASEYNFNAVNFHKIHKVLRGLLDFLPFVHKSGKSLNFFLKRNILFPLVHMCPENTGPFLEWIFKQDKDWFKTVPIKADCWHSIMHLPEDFALKVLNWGAELRTEGFEWKNICLMLYQLCRLHKPGNEKALAGCFNEVKKCFFFGKKMKRLLKDEFRVTYYSVFPDVITFLSYADYLKNGWKDLPKYLDRWLQSIENYIRRTADKDDLDFFQPYAKHQWICSIADNHEEVATLLEVAPMSHEYHYYHTYETVQWLAKEQKPLMQFIRRFATSRENVNRLLKLFTSFKTTVRLCKSVLHKELKSLSEKLGEDSLEALAFYRKKAGHEQEVPNNIRKIIELPQSLRKEEQTLQALFEKGRLSDNASQRLRKVETWLQDKKGLEDRVQNELAKALPAAVSNAKIDALLEYSERLCQQYWLELFGYPLEHWDDDWRNAIELCHTTRSNKRLLKKLIRNAAGKDFQWIYYHADNARFVKNLPEDFNCEAWVQPPVMEFCIDDSVYHIEAEGNLLKVLQMGNYFGSCLSVGSENDFSTIANAVEVNKHVLWIKDSKGKVIGRKLIVLTQGAELYGFNSYGAALEYDNEKPWFKIIFDLYCLTLAQMTNARLSNLRYQAESLVLFSKWYDDGIEEFDNWVMKLQSGKTAEQIAESITKETGKPGFKRGVMWLEAQQVQLSNWFKFDEVRLTGVRSFTHKVISD